MASLKQPFELKTIAVSEKKRVLPNSLYMARVILILKLKALQERKMTINVLHNRKLSLPISKKVEYHDLRGFSFTIKNINQYNSPH